MGLVQNHRFIGSVQIIAAALLATAVGLSGCTRQQEDGQPEVVFNDHPYPHLNRMNRERIGLFKKENPDIRVRFVPGDAYKLLGMIAGGMAPDVFITYTVSVPYFARRGVLMQLDDRVAADPEIALNQYFDCTVQSCRHDGKLYALPDSFSPVCLVYNKNLFREAGVPFPTGEWTWDQFLDACRKLTKDRDGDGRIDQYAIEVIWSYHRWPIFIWQNGGEIYDAKADRYVLDSPEAVGGIQWLHDLVYRHRVSPSRLEQLTGVASQSFEIRFAEQRVAMLASTRFYLDQMRGFGGFEIGVCHMPRGRRKATIMIGSNIMVHSGARHPEAAWRLARFLALPRAQAMSEACGRGLPAHIATAKQATHHPGLPPEGDEVFVEAADYCRPKDFEITELRRANWEVFEGLFYRVADNRMTPAEGCRAAARTLNEALGRFRATGGQ